MKKNPLSQFLLVMTLCSSTVCAEETKEAQHAQLQLIGERTVELGELPSYGISTTFFRLKNTGTTTARILGLNATCNCVKGSADKTVFGSNEECVIRFDLKRSLVHGPFKRSLWVMTNNAKDPRLLLSVSGTVKPLFNGMPEMPIRLASATPATVWTNTYCLTATETNLFLGHPYCLTNDALTLNLSFATNRIDGQNVYLFTIISTPDKKGFSGATAQIPVFNAQNEKISALSFRLHAIVGADLRVTPHKIALFNTNGPVVRRLHVRTPNLPISSDKLTWSPKIEGVKVTVSAGMNASILSVTLEISKEALIRLLKDKQAKLTFLYPDFNPADVEFFNGASTRPQTE